MLYSMNQGMALRTVTIAAVAIVLGIASITLTNKPTVSPSPMQKIMAAPPPIQKIELPTRQEQCANTLLIIGAEKYTWSGISRAFALCGNH